MSRRVLPSRSAKNKAKTIFVSLSDDDEEDGKDVKHDSKTKGGKAKQGKKSNRNNDRNITLNNEDDDCLPAIGLKVESDEEESYINRKKSSVSRKNKQEKATSSNYNSDEDDEEQAYEEEEDEEENNYIDDEDDDYNDDDDDEYSGVTKKKTTRARKKKKESNETTESPTSSFKNEEFDYSVPIKIEPEDYEYENGEAYEYGNDGEEYVNENDEEQISENCASATEEPLPIKPRRKRKSRRKEPPNFSFHIIKQERTAGDQNTAVWSTSAFTITAVLPTPKRNNDSNGDSTTDNTKKSRTRAKIKHLKINCPICNQEFRRVKLKRHLIQVHPGVEKPFKCNLCNTSWRSYDRLTDHQICHTDITPFKCDLCEKSFKRKYTLQAHVFYKHTTDGRASLSQFKTKRTVEKIQHPPIEPPNELGIRVGPYRLPPESIAPFKCPEPECDVEEDTITRIQRHYSQAHQIRDVMCEQCGKSFPGPRELSIHSRCHRDGRPWVCETCGSTYKSKAHLNSHRLRTHDPVGHEAYKAYRRMTCKKLNAKKKMLKELGKQPTETGSDASSSIPTSSDQPTVSNTAYWNISI